MFVFIVWYGCVCVFACLCVFTCVYVCVHVCMHVCARVYLLFVSHLGMVTIPKSLGHGNGEHYKSSRRGSFQMGETTNGHKVHILHYYLLHDFNLAIK